MVAVSSSSTTFIIAPTPTTSSKFADFSSTKNALYKAVNPIDYDIPYDQKVPGIFYLNVPRMREPVYFFFLCWYDLKTHICQVLAPSDH